MDKKTIEACRVLVGFAESHAEEVYTGFGDVEQDRLGEIDMNHTFECAEAVTKYLDEA